MVDKAALGNMVFPGSVIREGSAWFDAYVNMVGKYNLYDYYYSGQVFDEVADEKKPEESGLKYPLKINLVRQWTHLLSSFLFGQWEDNDSVISWVIKRKKQEAGTVAELEETRCRAMEEFLRDQWMQNENNAYADYTAIGICQYGGMVSKTVWDIVEGKIRDEWLAPDMFAPRWHPTSVDILLGAVLTYIISREDARDVFNLSENQYSNLGADVSVWEDWTAKESNLYVNDIHVLTRPNQAGFIPFSYIPRIRTPGDNYGYFGLSAVEDVMTLQDEINARLADIGDGIAYGSHPIRVVQNVTSKQDLEVGADALWDLGFGLGGRDPKAYILDTTGNYSGSLEYVADVEKLGRYSASLPSVAFGEDEGSQRSGTTLLIRFLPLTQEVRRMRLNLIAAMRKRSKMVLTLAAMYENPGFSVDDVKSHDITPIMAPILPKDVEDKINEWNVRIDGGFGTPEEAYRDLGNPEPKQAAANALKYMEAAAKAQQKGVQQNVGGRTVNAVGSRNKPTSGKSSTSPNKGVKKAT